MVSEPLWMSGMLRGACEWLPALHVQTDTKVPSVVRGVSLDSKATFKGPFMPPPHPQPRAALPPS